MMLKILNRDEFIQNFLLPITKIANTCVLILNKNKIHTFVSGESNNKSMCYCSTKQVECDFDSEKLGIKDVRVLISKLKQIPDNTFDLNINKNNITYVGKKISFVHILIEDRKIKIPAYKEDKFLSCPYDNKFVLKSDVLKTLLQCSTTLTESNKIYITTSEGQIIGDLDDRSKRNIDTYKLILNEDFNGSEIKNPISFSFEPFRVISTYNKKDILVSINTVNEIIEFDVSSDNYIVKYASSSLVN